MCILLFTKKLNFTYIYGLFGIIFLKCIHNYAIFLLGFCFFLFIFVSGYESFATNTYCKYLLLLCVLPVDIFMMFLAIKYLIFTINQFAKFSCVIIDFSFYLRNFFSPKSHNNLLQFSFKIFFLH